MKEDPSVVDAEIIDESASANHSHFDKPENDLKDKLLSADHWMRFVFMVLFASIAAVASYVVAVLIVIQFIFALFTGSHEERLRLFGSSISQYIFQILKFLTYNSEEKPFPFADWPTETEVQDSVDVHNAT